MPTTDETPFTCAHCERDYDVPEGWFAFMTPPKSRVAGFISICSEECLNALKATGWRISTEPEKDRLQEQIARYGVRRGP